MVRKHFITSQQYATPERFSRLGVVGMACGLQGIDEGCGEFTETSTGRESRFEYAETKDEVTCKRCLAWLRKNRP